MKTMKMLLAMIVWGYFGTLSMEGVILTHGMLVWQTGAVFAIIVVFCIISLVAIESPPGLAKLAQQFQF